MATRKPIARRNARIDLTHAEWRKVERAAARENMHVSQWLGRAARLELLASDARGRVAK